MGAASRNKGARYERAVVRWLKANGYPHVERRIAGMADDRGDLIGLPGLVIECKDHRTYKLGGWVDQLREEMRQARAETGVVLIHPPGVALDDVSNHYALMTGGLWLALTKAAGW